MTLRIENDAGTAILVDGGRITGRSVPDAVLIEAGPGEFLPGLINGHEHLHRNHYPRLGAPPYEDAYTWGADIHARHAADIAQARSLDRADALLFGALKNLMAGVTTVVHHDTWEPAFADDYPLFVPRLATVHSLGFEPDLAAALCAARCAALPLCIHLGEGVNPRAAGELAELEALGALDERLLAVHCVAFDDAAAARLLAAGSALVWCPSSNLFLFGRSVAAAVLQSGVDVLLGSDALLTGDGTLLEELRVARTLGHLDDARLIAAVSTVAARRLGLPAPSLMPGARADIVLLRRPLLEAQPADVALVVARGSVVLADASIPGVGRLIRDAAALDVGGVAKLTEARLVRAAERAVAISPACGRVFL